MIITGDAKVEFEELNMVVGDEIARGITSSEHQTLLNSIKQKIEFLKENPEYGIHIPKDRIPKEYIIKYDVNNLWKANLSGAWRMIYTIRGSEVDIISLILDMLGKNNSVRNEMECGANSAIRSYFFRHPENPATLDSASLRPDARTEFGTNSVGFARPMDSGRIFMILNHRAYEKKFGYRKG